MKPMGNALFVLLASLAIGICLCALASISFAGGQTTTQMKHATVITDGRLRPGHLESIGVAGFPGRGIIEFSFFPTAICEDECSAHSFRVGRTNAQGAARFQVRIPGTFIDHRRRSVYFRDGERIEVDAIWEGVDHSFDVARAYPQPIIVRVGPHHG
jgi:hypothetical protein